MTKEIVIADGVEAVVFPSEKPLMEQLWLELTERCNLSCIHCSIRRKRNDTDAISGELDTVFFCRLLSDAVELGCKKLQLTGGEILLRSDFIEVYSHAHHLNMDITVTTNATLLSKKIAELWTHLPPAKVKVSLYGWDAQSYDTVVQQPGAFRLFQAGLNRLASRAITFECLVPAIPVLIQHTDEICELAQELGVKGQPRIGWELTLHARHDPAGCERIQALRLSPEAAARQRMTVPKLILEDIRLVRQALKESTSSNDLLFPCIAAGQHLAVDAYGFLQPCRPLRHPAVLYDLKQGTLRQALLEHLPHIREIRGKNPRFCAQCAQCILRPACPSCPATSWMENGSLDDPAEYYCDIMHQEAYWLGLLPQGTKGWQVIPS